MLASTPRRWVLIETLWNVKEEIRHNYTVLTGFNRNIVECKVHVICTAFHAYRGFNRNIVECKVTNEKGDVVCSNSFNRNIVECKGSFRK